MFKTTIDLPTAVSGIANIVERFGFGHVATMPSGVDGCQYVIDPMGPLVPVCIVGQYLADLGILRAVLLNDPAYAGDQHGACGVYSVIWSNAEQMGVTFTDEAQAFLRYAQATQDTGENWGTAAFEALRNVQIDAEAEVINKVKKEFAMMRATLPMPPEEPLAEWERELLGDPE